MVPSVINDDLIVIVKDENNNILDTKRIAGDENADTETFGKVSYAKSKQDENGNMVYTLENLTLSDGQKITLNLTGTQYLNQGVYLYSANTYSTSQTFVGVAEGTRSVNLAVNIQFGVENPSLTVEHKTGTTVSSKTRSYIRENHAQTVYAEVQVTEIPETEPEDSSEPTTPVIPQPTPQTEPGIPVVEVGVEPGSEPASPDDPQPVLDPEYKELFEEDVPLDVRYMIPRTGDNMPLLLTLSLLSGMGLFVMEIDKYAIIVLTKKKGREYL
jgi:hypothetical protein